MSRPTTRLSRPDGDTAADRRREAIRRIVHAAPPVTPEQMDVIGGILRHTPDPREQTT
jgi:hypothetical protein